MNQLSGRVLERSSDAIVIIRLADRTVLGVNEAFFAVTGHPQHEIVGRHVDDLMVQLDSGRRPEAMDALKELGAVVDVPTGLWTAAGELRHGDLSALVVDADGQRDAVCLIRDVRDPTLSERRLAARERFTRTVEAGGARLEVATRAIRALGESLRWEFGALWLRTPEMQSLRCAVVWRSRLADLEPLEDASWRTACPFGVGLVGRCWRDGQAAWAPDALMASDPEPRQQMDRVGGLVRGWFGFPVWADAEVIGVVEFFSREVRQPDGELLQMTEQFGKLLGRFLEDGATSSRSSALRDLGHAAATVAGAMERQPDVRSMQESPQALRQLVASLGKLDRLQEGAVASHQEDGLEQQLSAVAVASSVERRLRVPGGLTLKAVSRRTGIPAATLRTWERRYGFLRPMRSSNGYRLYGEQEIAQVLEIKNLLEQGIRIGAAMEAVRGRFHRSQAAG